MCEIIERNSYHELTDDEIRNLVKYERAPYSSFFIDGAEFEFRPDSEIKTETRRYWCFARSEIIKSVWTGSIYYNDDLKVKFDFNRMREIKQEIEKSKFFNAIIP